MKLQSNLFTPKPLFWTKKYFLKRAMSDCDKAWSFEV